MNKTFTFLSKRGYAISLLILFFAGCTNPDFLSKPLLNEFLNDPSNGYKKEFDTETVQMTITYRPSDFMIWQTVEGENDSLKIRNAFDHYNEYLYFLMQLSAGDEDALYGTSGSQAEFNDKLQTISFRMGEYINLTTSNQDTIPLADSYYSRMFGLGNSNDILLVFSKKQLNNEQLISINCKEFGFNTGRRAFRFQLEDLKNAPKLEELKPFYDMIKKSSVQID